MSESPMDEAQETAPITINGAVYVIPKAVWSTMYEVMAERNALQSLVVQMMAQREAMSGLDQMSQSADIISLH